MVFPVVENELRIDRMSCAATGSAWSGRSEQLRAVPTDGVQPGTTASNTLASVMAWPMTSPCRAGFADGGEDRIEFRRVDRGDNGSQVFEHGVDLDGDIARVQHRARPQRLGIRAALRDDEVDVFGAGAGKADLISASTLPR